jgi:hypothetical protein
VTEHEPGEFARAYQVLGVPHSSSAAAIKHAYRDLAKRWHPDRYRGGSAAHEEATRMMKAINEAYALIENAPLEYYFAAYPRTRGASRETARPPGPVYMERDPLPESGRFGFWVRFAFGALLGLFWGGWFALRLYPLSPIVAVTILGAGVAACGLASAHYGDRFWYGVFRVGR